MLADTPETETDLEGVHGLGSVRAAKYGRDILAAAVRFQTASMKPPNTNAA